MNYLEERSKIINEMALIGVNTDQSVYSFINDFKESKIDTPCNKRIYHEITYEHILEQYVKLQDDDKCCALCCFWHEKDKEPDNVNRLPASATALPAECLEAATSLVNKYRFGYCAKKTDSKNIAEKAATDICTDFIDSRKENEIYSCSHIYMNSPKERFLNCIRKIHFMLELEKVYYNGILRELYMIQDNQILSESNLNKLKDYEKKLRKCINSGSTVRRISEITNVSPNVIRNQLFRGTKKGLYHELISGIAEYYCIPLEKLYGFTYIDTRYLLIFEELGLFKVVSLDASAEFYPNTKIPSHNKLPVVPDESFIYIISVLLNICSTEEIEKVIRHYEAHEPKCRSVSYKRNNVKHIVPERDRINRFRGSNTIPDIAASAGVSQKDMEHIMAGKSKLEGSRLYSISESIGIEPDLITDESKIPENRSSMKVFTKLTDKEYAEECMRNINEGYIAFILSQMYNIYPSITKRIMKLYISYGIDRIREEYINNELKLNAYLKKNHPNEFLAICGEGLDGLI